MKKRRRKLNKRGKLVIFLFSLLLCSIFLINIIPLNKKEIKKTNKITTSKKIEEKKEDKLSLIMVGDNLIHDKIYKEAQTLNGYDFTKFYSKIKPIVKAVDKLEIERLLIFLFK